MAGSEKRSGCSVSTISWQGAALTVFGEKEASRASLGSIFTFSMMPSGGLISRSSATSSAAASRLSTPSAIRIRSSEA